MIVIDNSAIVEALVGAGPAGRAVVARIEGEHLVAPELLDVEAASTLRGLVRGGKLSVERARRALEALAELPIERVSHVDLLARVWQLRDNVTPYDAVYVALAERLDVGLLTGDRRLASAPSIRCVVETIG